MGETTGTPTLSNTMVQSEKIIPHTEATQWTL